jgi:hypothetical protein
MTLNHIQRIEQRIHRYTCNPTGDNIENFGGIDPYTI